jgi:hypothetical protein
MTLPMAAREATADRPRRRSFEPVMTFTGEGLVLGGTILAPLRHDRDEAPEIAINGAEERILALLAVAYRKTALPGTLGSVRRAARYWHRGENDLAAIEIALSGLPPLADEKEASARLFLGERLLAEGLSPRELIKICGLDPASLDFLKAGYNPDQPRVPGGNPDGGQWTSEGGDTSPAAVGEGAGSSTPPRGQPSSAIGGKSAPGVNRVDPNVEFVSYTPEHGLPSNAVVVKTPGGKTIADPDSETKKLMAPPGADFRIVYAAGQAIASLPIPEQYSKGRAAIAQGGTYDFQRDVIQQKFYYPYVHAANYAVGVYMAGAGYSLPATLFFAKLYALRNSSNYDAQDQLGWIKRGWRDGKAGIWK